MARDSQRQTPDRDSDDSFSETLDQLNEVMESSKNTTSDSEHIEVVKTVRASKEVIKTKSRAVSTVNCEKDLSGIEYRI